MEHGFDGLDTDFKLKKTSKSVSNPFNPCAINKAKHDYLR